MNKQTVQAERDYTVRVHRGQIEPDVLAQMRKAGLKVTQLPEADVTVTVRAPRDGMAMTRAMVAANLPARGQTIRYYEQLADGTERELLHGA